MTRYHTQVRHPHKKYITVWSTNYVDEYGWKRSTSLPNRSYRILDTETNTVIRRKTNP